MRFVFHDQAWADYLYWQANDRRILQRVNALLKECSRTPFEGIGKPEALRGDLAGWWSRRIDREHRLIYRPVGDELHVAQCRFHY